MFDFWEYMRRGSIYPLYADHCIAWTSISKKYYNFSPKIAIAYFSNDTVFFRVCRKETIEGGKMLYKSILSNKSEFNQFKELWNHYHNRLSEWINNTKISNLDSFDSNVKKINEFSELNKEIQAVWTAKEYIDAYLSENKLNLVGESFSSAENKMLNTIYHEFEKIDKSVWLDNSSILSLPNKIFSTDPSIKILIDDYLKKYYWTGTTYAEIQNKDELAIINQYRNKLLNQNQTAKQSCSFVFKKEITLLNDDLFQLFETRKKLLLKSFYIVHKIYEKLAQHLDIYVNQAKWITPLEWTIVNAKNHFDIEKVTERMHCSYIECYNGNLNWFTGKKAFEKEMDFRRANFNLNHHIIKGMVVYQGSLEGEVVIIKDNIELPNNNKKYIIITGMTTPDYLHLLNRALAVITDEGGVTCHAAIICRELQIPCIVGTKISTKIFSTGDFVKIEHDSITKIDKKELNIQTKTHIPLKIEPINSTSIEPYIDFTTLNDVKTSSQKTIGNKAYNIAVLIDNNFCISNGFVLYGNDFNSNKISDFVKKSNISSNKLYAVRSSAIDEDSITSSKAGFYQTFLNVSYSDLCVKIKDCAEEMLSHQKGCSVLIQEMFEAKISGVAFTAYVSTGREDLMLIEALTGIGAVVDGIKTPQRYICKKQSLIIERIDINDTIEPNIKYPHFKLYENKDALIKPDTLRKLCTILKEIEIYFNYSCDIEWAIDENEKINILQCRPIVFNN